MLGSRISPLGYLWGLGAFGGRVQDSRLQGLEFQI